MEHITRIRHTIIKIKGSYALVSEVKKTPRIFRTKNTGLENVIRALNEDRLGVENARQLLAEINELPIASTRSKKPDLTEDEYTLFLDDRVDELRPLSFQEAEIRKADSIKQEL